MISLDKNKECTSL